MEAGKTTIEEIEKRLQAAQARLKKAIDALAPKHKGGEMDEYRSAQSEVLALERQLAAAKGDQYAVPFEFPVKWDVGAPVPHLIMSGRGTYLAFYVSRADPNWGRNAARSTARQPNGDSGDPLAVVEFRGCVSAKLGAPNDEVFEGHPVFGKGLEPYSAQIIENSRWIEELQAMSKVHHGHQPDAWKGLNHYMFWFHDETFECVAESYHVEVSHLSLRELLSGLCQRILR